MKIILSTLIVFGLAAGCDNSRFSGGAQKGAAPAAPAPDNPVPEVGNTAPVPPIDCTEEGSTSAKLLTTSVQNKAPGQFIKYELELLNCDGTPRPIKDAPVKFDIDASLDTLGAALPYVIQDMSGKQVTAGSLKTVSGSDLFGKTGLMYQYWATDTVTLGAQENKIIIQFDVSNILFSKMDGLIPTPPTGDIELPTYLRYGDASPVEKMVVFKK